MKGPLIVQGLKVEVGANFEKALRIFSKKVQGEGLVRELREREFYEKKTSKKKKAKMSAKRREKKRMRESMPNQH